MFVAHIGVYHVLGKRAGLQEVGRGHQPERRFGIASLPSGALTYFIQLSTILDKRGPFIDTLAQHVNMALVGDACYFYIF